jgi:hypothetical protein
VKFQNIVKHLNQNFSCQLGSHLSLIDPLFSLPFRIFFSPDLVYFPPRCFERSGLFPYRTIHRSMVETPTVQTPPISKPLRPFLIRNPSPACAEVDRCWSSISGYGSGGCALGSLRGCWCTWCAWGSCRCSPFMLRRFLRLPLLNLVVPFLAQHYKRRKLIRHVGMYKGILNFFGLSRPQGISESRRISI